MDFFQHHIFPYFCLLISWCTPKMLASLGFSLLEKILCSGSPVSSTATHLLVFLLFYFFKETPHSNKLIFWGSFFASLSVWKKSNRGTTEKKKKLYLEGQWSSLWQIWLKDKTGVHFLLLAKLPHVEPIRLWSRAGLLLILRYFWNHYLF